MTDSISSQGTTPCCDHKTGGRIIQLSVAPQLTARTRFSAPPSKKRKVLSPAEALQVMEKCVAESPSVAMAAITGPGEPLATPDLTFAVTRLIRSRFPQLPIGLLTMGIGGAGLAGELIQQGVSYVEIQVEGVRREILEKIYAWIRPGAKTIKLREAAELLLKEQRSAVSAFKFHGIKVVILTTLYPGCNVDHVAKISAEMMELGADGMALLPYFSDPDAEVELEEPDDEAVSTAWAKAATYLPPVTSLLVRQPGITCKTDNFHESDKPLPSPQRPNAAVVSSNGIEVDLHLGHAGQFLVYGPRPDGLVCLLETRKAPQPGSADKRWQLAGDILNDCFVLLTASAGNRPCALLAEQGLTVVTSEENIEGLIDVLYGGGKKKKRSPATGPDTGEF